MKKILITRPEPQAQTMAQEMEAMGFATLCCPVMKVETVLFELPEPDAYDVLLWTSANAAHYFCEYLESNADQITREKWLQKKAICVGDKTAEALRIHGFTDITSASGEVGAMIDLIRKTDEAMRGQGHPQYLHIRGHHAARPLHVWLAQYDIKVDILPVYKTAELCDITETITKSYKNRDIQAVLHMSPRSAAAYAKAVTEHGLLPFHDSIISLSISPAVLECVQSISWKRSLCAEKPDKASLYALLEQSCTTE
jgi:uroporphyrinogen-III synthase